MPARSPVSPCASTCASRPGPHRRDADAADAGTTLAYDRFPELREHAASRAGDLSGGQQQMLNLAMALVARPRLLLLDELSLGLAPVVVERLLGVVRELAASGTTMLLVEQSVPLALEVAARAYFLEQGVVRFEGPTRELLDRPDLVRAVFLDRAPRRPRVLGTLTPMSSVRACRESRVTGCG